MIFIIAVFLFAALLVLGIIDFRHMILPDVLTLPLIIAGLVFSWSQGVLPAAIIGAIVGYTSLVLLETVYKKIKNQDGIGRGDAKLLAAGGAWCGWFGLPFIILIASASGLAHAFLASRAKDEKITKLPFGPHLALGIFIVWLVLFVFGGWPDYSQA